MSDTPEETARKQQLLEEIWKLDEEMERQIAEQAYAYLNATYWKSPEVKDLAEDAVLGFLDFLFPEEGNE